MNMSDRPVERDWRENSSASWLSLVRRGQIEAKQWLKAASLKPSAFVDRISEDLKCELKRIE